MRTCIATLLLALGLASPALADDATIVLRDFMPVELTAGRLDRNATGALVARALTAPRAPAPPISQVAVLAVGSSQAGGWEYMTSPGQLSTALDHGGSELRVVVRQIGYGGSPIGSLRGSALPGGAQYMTERLCVDGSGYTQQCQPGQTIVGWLYYFNLDGAQDGDFGFQNTSLNAPFNTAYTAIHIR